MNLRQQISQQALGKLISEKLGRTGPFQSGTVSRWESGDALPDIPTLQAIAELSGLNPGWIAFGTQTLGVTFKYSVIP